MRNSEEIMVIRENNTKILELFKKHKEKLKGSLTVYENRIQKYFDMEAQIESFNKSIEEEKTQKMELEKNLDDIKNGLKKVDSYKIYDLIQIEKIWVERLKEMENELRNLQKKTIETKSVKTKSNVEIQNLETIIKHFKNSFKVLLKVKNCDGDIFTAVLRFEDWNGKILHSFVEFKIDKNKREIISFNSTKICNLKQEQVLQERFKESGNLHELIYILRKICLKRSSKKNE